MRIKELYQHFTNEENVELKDDINAEHGLVRLLINFTISITENFTAI